MTNKHHTVVYVGVTNSLARRAHEHKTRSSYRESFTKKYNISKLVYYESYDYVQDAIAREKQLKGGSRANKINLINKLNPNWKDLYSEVYPD